MHVGEKVSRAPNYRGTMLSTGAARVDRDADCRPGAGWRIPSVNSGEQTTDPHAISTLGASPFLGRPILLNLASAAFSHSQAAQVCAAAWCHRCFCLSLCEREFERVGGEGHRADPNTKPTEAPRLRMQGPRNAPCNLATHARIFTCPKLITSWPLPLTLVAKTSR